MPTTSDNGNGDIFINPDHIMVVTEWTDSARACVSLVGGEVITFKQTVGAIVEHIREAIEEGK